ncbi:MAG: DUF1080 domain-containing protein [Verrucomicrobiota bacterium]
MRFPPCLNKSSIFLSLVVVLLKAVFFEAAAADLPAVLVAEPGAWVNVMPSADLRGWTRLAIPGTNALGRAQWHLDAAQRLLACDGDGGHEMLRFDRKLTNCIFHVEFRFVPLTVKRPKYNSGIYIRNSADGTIWHQCQLTFDGGYLFGKTPVNGQLQSFMAPAENRCMKPAGEWNTVEITACATTLTVWFNGALMSELANCEMPAGYIGLESEGFAVEFRNLKLKELP